MVEIQFGAMARAMAMVFGVVKWFEVESWVADEGREATPAEIAEWVKNYD